MKYSHQDPTLITIYVFAMTHEDLLNQDFKTADVELSEQLEYKGDLAKDISTLNFKWNMFAVVCLPQNQEKWN